MQTAVVPPGPIPSYPSSSSHTSQSHPASSNITPASSFSANQPAPGQPGPSSISGGGSADISGPSSRPPHNGPAYPSINQSNSNYNPAYSNGGPQQQQQWYSPQYFQQQQPFQPRQFPNGANNANYGGGGGPRYDGYTPFPPQGLPGPGYYQPHYPQMGGPGPGTLQNGYGAGSGYPDGVGAYPPYMRTNLPYNQNHHQAYPIPPNDIPQSAPSSQNSYSESGENSIPVHSDAPPYHQHPPQPAIPPPGPDGYTNQLQQPPYPTYFPPNHPYAYGSGFGHPPYPPQPGPSPVWNGNANYNGYPDNQPHSRDKSVNSSSASSSSAPKGLNPAAAGFNFVPASQRNKELQPTAPAPIVAKPTSEQTEDVTPVFASITSTSTTATSSQASQPPVQQTNGHIDPKKFAPVIVNGEKLKGIGGRRNSEDEHEQPDSLGLSQLNNTSSTPSPSVSIPTTTAATQSTSTPAMTSSPTTPTTPISVRTPRALTPSIALSPQAALNKEIENLSWNFVGPTVSGYSSPPTNPSTGPASPPSAPSIRSFSQAMGAGPSQKAKAKGSTETGPLSLSANRPDIGVCQNTYALSLAASVPNSVKTVVAESTDEPLKQTSRGRRTASGKKFVFSAGTGQASRLRMLVSDLIFGEVTPEAESVESPPAVVAPAQSSPQSVPIPEIVAPTSAPEAKPKIPPSSWAALLRTPSSSIAPSKVTSPASEAGPALSLASASEPVTPKSHTSALPPSSTGGASSTGLRPVFNYAAAAAAGAALSPQEELAKLLSEGVKRKSVQTPLTVPRGLINTGNMCFANTTLQVLVYCAPFTELFEELGKRLKADLARKTPLLEAMIIFLREFAPTQRPLSGISTPRSESSNKGKSKEKDVPKEAFIPENVYDAMKENKRFDSMRRGYQEDAEEYLGFFLNTLHEEILYLISRTAPSKTVNGTPPVLVNGDSHHDERSIQRPVSPGADNHGDGWLEVGKKQKTNVVRNTESRESAVSRLFGGTLRSVLHTPGSKDSVTLEPYQPLQLDVQSSEVSSITDALKHLSAPEIVPGVWSSSRNANVDATKQVYIETFPNVLILHLKRFVYDGLEMSVVKRSKPVAYGTELVIPKEVISPAKRSATPIKYRLFGVIYHHGTSASGGHYTVSVARQDTAAWYHFDDELVTTVPTDQVVISDKEAEEAKEKGDFRGITIGGRERCAYLLFYQRVRAKA